MSSVSATFFGAPLSALQVHSITQQVAAHNVANINTAGFVPQRATLAESASHSGVELQAILTGHEAAGSARVTPDGQDMAPFFTGGQASSGTELAREMVHMITGQHAFSANAQVVRSGDEMLGTLLDIKG